MLSYYKQNKQQTSWSVFYLTFAVGKRKYFVVLQVYMQKGRANPLVSIFKRDRDTGEGRGLHTTGEYLLHLPAPPCSESEVFKSSGPRSVFCVCDSSQTETMMKLTVPKGWQLQTPPTLLVKPPFHQIRSPSLWPHLTTTTSQKSQHQILCSD